MKFTVRQELKLALTLLFVLAVYFQSLNHPFSRFDDPGIIEHYGISNALSFLDVISTGTGIYYRPIVSLSYWLDSRLWGMDPSFMHLENIAVHLINVFLVFLIASRLPASSQLKVFPVFCALLFGLHPINSEPVNWIPGRTDLFAGMFILLAFYFLIRAISEQSIRYALLAFITAFIGTLTKETAIMFIPVAFLVIMYWPVVTQDMSWYKTWRTKYLIIPAVTVSSLVSSLLILMYFKGHGNNALSLISEGDSNGFLKPFEALGFYVKKMFLPFPLNVAIKDVDPLYAIVGILTIIILVVTIRRAGIPSIFLASAIMFIFPALVVAISSFAWAPFGERYLYIPSAFAVIGCLDFFHRNLVNLKVDKWFVAVVSLLIVVASITTFQRCKLWGDNLALLQDVVAKSPYFGVARNEYGVLLREAGRYDEAEKQFKIGLQQKNKENVSRIIRLNLIWTKIYGKQPTEARRILLSEIGNKASADVELLKQLNRYDEYMLGKAVPLENKKKIVADIIETSNNLYLRTGEPHYLYRSGQLLLSIGNKRGAAMYFRKAYESAPHDAYYREPARRLEEELGAK
jgi:tetratricopeptide (TPR) repeat protein